MNKLALTCLVSASAIAVSIDSEYDNIFNGVDKDHYVRAEDVDAFMGVVGSSFAEAFESLAQASSNQANAMNSFSEYANSSESEDRSMSNMNVEFFENFNGMNRDLRIWHQNEQEAETVADDIEAEEAAEIVG